MGAMALAAVILLGVAPAVAQTKNRCAAGKNKCVSDVVKGLLKCHERALKSGSAIDDACLDRAHSKFDGGDDPARACFARLEAKNPPGSATECLTYDDAEAAGLAADAFASDVIEQVDPTAVKNCCSYLTDEMPPVRQCAQGWTINPRQCATLGKDGTGAYKANSTCNVTTQLCN